MPLLYYFTLSNARRFYLLGGVLPLNGLRAYQVYFRDWLLWIVRTINCICLHPNAPYVV
jgi:hypothetical protein